MSYNRHIVFTGTLSVVYLLIFVLVKGYMWGINISSLPTDTRAWNDAAVLSGMLALSFYIHNIIITIMSNNERQDKNVRNFKKLYLEGIIISLIKFKT